MRMDVSLRARLCLPEREELVKNNEVTNEVSGHVLVVVW